MSDVRTLPHSLDAERAVLGAILTDNAAMYEVGAVLTTEHFFRQSHQRVYGALVSLAERGIPADEITVKDELKRRGELEDVGGPAFIAGLSNGMPRRTNVPYYAGIVREKAALRALIVTAARVVESAYEASDDASVVMDEAERALLTISQEAMTGDLTLVGQFVPETMAMLEQIWSTKRPVTGLASGFPALDNYTRGLHAGNLVVLGGRPGDGKSALALQMALEVSKQAPVAFFSMEMSKDEILTRAFAQVARVDHHQMMQGRLSGPDQEAVKRAKNDVEQRWLAIDDTAALTPFQIRSKARKLQAKHGLGLVVVDYIQLLQRPRTAHSREEAVADNTWGLKVIAGEMRVPVVALSQLNRSSTKEERRPTLSDLRESGAVEQHANVVLLIYRPPAQSNGIVSETPAVELLIAKQRNGPQGVTVDLMFRGPSMRFEEIDHWRSA